MQTCRHGQNKTPSAVAPAADPSSQWKQIGWVFRLHLGRGPNNDLPCFVYLHFEAAYGRTAGPPVCPFPHDQHTNTLPPNTLALRTNMTKIRLHGARFISRLPACRFVRWILGRLSLKPISLAAARQALPPGVSNELGFSSRSCRAYPAHPCLSLHLLSRDMVRFASLSLSACCKSSAAKIMIGSFSYRSERFVVSA